MSNPNKSLPFAQFLGDQDVLAVQTASQSVSQPVSQQGVEFNKLYKQNVLLNFTSEFIAYLDAQAYQKTEGGAESGLVELEFLLFEWFVQNHTLKDDSNIEMLTSDLFVTEQITQVQSILDRYSNGLEINACIAQLSDEGFNEKDLAFIMNFNSGNIQSSWLVFKINPELIKVKSFKETLEQRGYSVIDGLAVHNCVLGQFQEFLQVSQSGGTTARLFKNLKFQLASYVFELDDFISKFINDLDDDYDFDENLVVTDEENQILNIIAKSNYLLGLLSTRFYDRKKKSRNNSNLGDSSVFDETKSMAEEAKINSRSRFFYFGSLN